MAANPASQEQTNCDRCGEPLVPQAAFCESCGERTRRARRLTRIAVRVELLVIALVLALVLGFAFIYYQQG